MPPPALLTARGGMRGPLPWTTGITAIYAAKGVIFTRRSGGQYSTPIDTLGVQAVEHHRRKVRFFATVDLVNALEQEKAANKAGQIAERLLKLDLIILD